MNIEIEGDLPQFGAENNLKALKGHMQTSKLSDHGCI